MTIAEQVASDATNGTKERLRATATGSSGVDREAKLISGYVVAELGPFKSRDRGQFNRNSLEKIVELGNKAKYGLKSRFTHPDLSSDGLGKFVGRSKNFRLDGKKVRADLKIADVAMKPPPEGGGTPYGEYVMDLAESDPDAFSSSLVLEATREYVLDKEGRRKKDKNGAPIPPIWTPTKLFASDIVDTGDAVNGFLDFDDFSIDELPDAAVRNTAATLDSLFSGMSREEVESRCQSFLTRYLDRQFGDQPMAESNDSAVLDQLKKMEEWEAKTTEAIVGALKDVGDALKSLSEANKEPEQKDPTPQELAAEERKKVEHYLKAGHFEEDMRKELLSAHEDGVLSVDELRDKAKENRLKKLAPIGDDGDSSEKSQKLKDAKQEYREFEDIHRAFGLSEKDLCSDLLGGDSGDVDYLENSYNKSLERFKSVLN